MILLRASRSELIVDGDPSKTKAVRRNSEAYCAALGDGNMN
jgi:hypothetical protein